MSKGGAHFTSRELALVLSHYDIGIIQQIKPLVAGNRGAPKQIIISDTGRYLLKRRAKGKDDRYRVAFAHAVQQHLKDKNFPVSRLICNRDEKNSFLELDNHIYELFEFVNGTRFDGKIESVVDCGSSLAKFHLFLKDFSFQPMPLKGSFHDSNAVRGYLKKIGSEKNNDSSNDTLRKTTESLMTMYNNSSVNVNQLGYDEWPQQIIHGDWHPGNMLFSSGKVVAVVDFDSLKVSSILTDLANGALQFSIVGGRPNPADWPDYLDQSRFVHFLHGYCEVNMLNEDQFETMPDLMIETLIAEAVLPIAATGYFINLSGTDFLKMIQRKCAWIDNNRNTLFDAIKHALRDLSK
jgi:Ser/Thr protein kinase RdoA (MazF antagonist)